MIDIHAHILPGVDDGAGDLYDAVDMVRMAEDCGVTDMIATPHCNVPGQFRNYYGEWFREKMEDLQGALERERIRVRIHPGMEVYATYDLPQLLREGRVLTLCGSRYLLVEFDFQEDPEFADRMLDRLASLRVCPVVAHAERYRFVQDFPELVYEWSLRGYGVQINKGSITGRFGRHAQRTVFRLLEHGLVSAVASDAHSPFRRTPYLLDAFEALAGVVSEEDRDRLFRGDPFRILRGMPLADRKRIPF